MTPRGEGIGLIEAMRTTGAVRDFLPEPVPDEVVHQILEHARFAPSGGNRQGWRVVVVKDPAIRRRLRDLYLPPWREYLAMRRAGLTPFAPVTDREAERRAVEEGSGAGVDIGEFAARFDEVPVLLVLLADLRALAAMDRDLPRYTLVGGASIYPFAHNVLLAAREYGLAGVMTTITIRSEPEMKEMLGVPPELAVAGVLALGRPRHQPRRLTRQPVEAFATVDRFDGPPFTG